MSAINVLVQEQAAHMMTDGSSYIGPSGRLLGVDARKAIPILNRRSALACTGPALLGEYLAGALQAEFGSFDELVERGGDPEALRLLKLRYGIVLPFKIPDFSDRTFTLYQKLYLGIGVASMSVWFVVTFVAFLSLEFIGIVSILRNPTFSLTISILNTTPATANATRRSSPFGTTRCRTMRGSGSALRSRKGRTSPG